ncbi:MULTISPECIES: phosphate ABC transporter substrate-binding protein [unclassified Herbaspirillum]|uniref:phosphate ABC transporter substrate-binding protein n=1 Tax=unclassified Herbaspirillum TaxID=2624150 RepID=UPI001153DB4C|nr:MULTISPECIES: phosphate ABC transporter substrate-binding protein [unclassified Herbaspirillum]MBB5390450.1 4,5-dihydroxyphthalate decarboxylase [Herbaspirillum sp. SJZ102]TQK09055.1 4,5-dihydroxyphthalate decarboxylase [Herbaspirillum sp. SJZ130]TQK14258.1 4,5-dihydroxyphthalate decarboxylase [Herbaspirillum sp. SJZ106]
MTTTATEVPILRTNLAEYAVTKAMRDGRVKSDIVELDYCGPTPAHNGFKAMVRENQFDAGELAIVTFLQAKAYGKPYVLLPTPISGRFQHHCAGYNIDFGHLDPKDIEGKKVGVRTYTQTTALWIRGILRHEYGVDLDKVTWMTLNDGHLAEYSDPSNCQRLPKGSSIPQMMLDGQLDAALLGEDMPKDPRVRTLVPNAKEAAKDWFAREGVVPINHMFVVHEDISKKHPEIVRELYRMVVESRALTEGGVPEIFPPIGLEPNRKGIQLAIDWALDQKIIPRRLTVDELFDDVTGALG